MLCKNYLTLPTVYKLEQEKGLSAITKKGKFQFVFLTSCFEISEGFQLFRNPARFNF